MRTTRAILGVFLVFAVPVKADDAARDAPPPMVVQHGEASYYSDKFQGRPTASGEPHDQNALTAASKDLPLGSTARVTNLENGKTVDVEITDRGRLGPRRVIDLSKRAAASIGIGKAEGTAPVRVEASAGNQPTPELQDKVATLSANLKAKQRVRAKAAQAKSAKSAQPKTAADR